MKSFVINPALHLRGRIVVPGDKSIAHRAIIISALSRGTIVIENFPRNKDCLSTLNAFKRLGIKIKSFPNKGRVIIYGQGLHGFKKPKGPIFAGDSGTTLRLLLGVLAGQQFSARLTAGRSLSKRPMLRVTAPLRKMGAHIKAKVKGKDEYAPITIKGGALKSIRYRMPVASAQVKSALLLAGLYAQGSTEIFEPVKTRDHSERMLAAFKANIKVKKKSIIIKGNREMVSPKKIYIPGDLSSTGFFMVLAALMPRAEIVLKNISLNPSRMGIIKVLKRMSAKLHVSGVRCQVSGGEPMGDIAIENSSLKATRVLASEVPALIDELPILMVAAACARGTSIFEGVQELRVKETDRISSMAWNLRKMGVKVEVVSQGKSEKVIINGASQLQGSALRSFGDHRTAMSMVVAGLVAQGKSSIDDISCIAKSFPQFFKILNPLIR